MFLKTLFVKSTVRFRFLPQSGQLQVICCGAVKELSVLNLRRLHYLDLIFNENLTIAITGGYFAYFCLSLLIKIFSLFFFSSFPNYLTSRLSSHTHFNISFSEALSFNKILPISHSSRNVLTQISRKDKLTVWTLKIQNTYSTIKIVPK